MTNPDTQRWLADFEGTLADLRQKSQALEENIAAAATTVSSPDGSVTVTVAPNGGLQQLVLGHRACELGPARLTALIMQTVHKGQRLAAHKVAEAFVPMGAGTEAMGMLTSHLPELDEDDERLLEAEQAGQSAPAGSTPPPLPPHGAPGAPAPAQAPASQPPTPPLPPSQPVPPWSPGLGAATRGNGFPPPPPSAGPGAAGRPRPQQPVQDDDDDDVDLW
ncbi:YbaB/EbfC DNA-binding family protein [Streptoalloteichus tenebrarius]|uniref:YbaB/EbfC DNA-binding family protein n=1 Tax=Streptoalloteichus tenebrarius (strain ATCC 17920 / DSM 40477 / JCM 4838 / CBS 697.72 / NBRC 16177 / NCIMB 11028 / NRRL B-12390 / A12253. 1 / ISP 5477) TaxID=1933 RepID=A0ABT1I123_STRSD|nr:YbaB/EbfC family nucleoid-associated protein [Streptoalloteichus tenebrarius]MCP2261494.1 YbaB/EbfC DNA-binding family protein [Streptoalloteichus tenebrarius]BFE99348.1 hypothetical protein GCM10020241_10240 [Streptoalloteichus tenebrarius]